MPSWISDTSRRTSPPDRPAMMKANVDTAPIAPSRHRAKKISPRLRAKAIRTKPEACSPCVHTNARLGSRLPASHPEIGAVITVMSGLIPRMKPVQRSVVAASNRDRSWM